MAVSSNNTLLRSMEWAKKLNFGRSAALGNFLEPALTSANTIMQTIIGPPFAWRWNRIVTGFMAAAGQQDYTLINWTPGMTVMAGWQLIDTSGNSQIANADGVSGSTVPAWPAWNGLVGGTTTDGSVTWVTQGTLGGLRASQPYSLGFMESVSVLDKTNASVTVIASTKWYEITSQLCLSSDSAQGRPRFISAQADDGQGNITFRVTPVPDKAYPVAITMQQKPPVFTSVNTTWAPIPDEYARIYNWGFLSLMWLFADDPRFGIANQKFVSQLLSTSEGLTETQRNIFLQGWQQQTGQPMYNGERMQQGVQARGI